MRVAFPLVMAAGVMAIAPAFAQTPPAPANPAPAATAPAVAAPAANPDAPANRALNTRDVNNPGAPAAGHNSFTEGQARSRLERDGYTAVSQLIKDDQGVWRGRASKGGQTVEVAVDYQGNIVPR